MIRLTLALTYLIILQKPPNPKLPMHLQQAIKDQKGELIDFALAVIEMSKKLLVRNCVFIFTIILSIGTIRYLSRDLYDLCGWFWLANAMYYAHLSKAIIHICSGNDNCSEHATVAEAGQTWISSRA